MSYIRGLLFILQDSKLLFKKLFKNNEFIYPFGIAPCTRHCAREVNNTDMVLISEPNI